MESQETIKPDLTPELSLFLPVLDEEDNLRPMHAKIAAALDTLGKTAEVIYVDDGSTDNSLKVLRDLADEDDRVRVISLRRNYGQTAAMSAGIDAAKGDILIPMDADLQNDPADISRLLEKLDEGYDVVSGWRKDRQDKLISRKIPSQIANKIISWIGDVPLHDYGCSLKAYRRDVIQDVRLYGEMHRFIPALASWAGASVDEVVVSQYPRRFGTSKYGISRTIRVILDLFTVKFLLHYSTGPIQLFGKFASLFAVPAFLMLLLLAGDRLFGWFDPYLLKRPFWVITPLMLLAFAVQFVSMGLLAEMQIRTYHESQDKPIYVIKETVESQG